MRFASASEHRDFFRKQHLIEFEDLLSEAQLKLLLAAIDSTLASRLKTYSKKAMQLSAMDLFMAGRDLWRSSEAIKRVVLAKQLAEMVFDLMEIKPLRLGYDQLIAVNSLEDQSLVGLEPKSLQAMSCLQGVLCGIMLCLSSSANSDSPQTSLFPNKAGNAVFFSAEVEIDFKLLNQHLGQRYLLIAYTQPTALYVSNPCDPNVHSLKSLGYNFGDKLTDKLHPIVYR